MVSKTELEKKAKEFEDCKKTIQNLKAVKEETESIYNSIMDGIVIMDLTGKIIKVNHRISKVTGYPEEEFLGKRFSDIKLITLKRIPALLMTFAKIIAGKKTTPKEMEITLKTGEKKTIEVYGSAFKINGKFKGVISVLRDITKRKEAESKLKEKADELEKFNKAMIGRELKMIALKEEISALNEKIRQLEAMG